MPYARQFNAVSDLAYLTRKGRPDVVAKIQAALDSGKKVEWVSSLFEDPGPDYNKVTIDDEQVYHEDGY